MPSSLHSTTLLNKPTRSSSPNPQPYRRHKKISQGKTTSAEHYSASGRKGPQVPERTCSASFSRSKDKFDALLDGQQRSLAHLGKQSQLHGISFVLSAPIQSNLAHQISDDRPPVRDRPTRQSTGSRRSPQRNLPQIFIRSLLRTFFFVLVRVISRRIRSDPARIKGQLLPLLYCYAMATDIAIMLVGSPSSLKDDENFLQLIRRVDRYALNLLDFTEAMEIFRRYHLLFWDQCEDFEYKFKSLIDQMDRWLYFKETRIFWRDIVLGENSSRTQQPRVESALPNKKLEVDQSRIRKSTLNPVICQVASSDEAEDFRDKRLWGRSRRELWKGKKKRPSLIDELQDWSWYHLCSGTRNCWNSSEDFEICNEDSTWQDGEVEQVKEQLTELILAKPLKDGTGLLGEEEHRVLTLEVNEWDEDRPWLSMVEEGVWSKEWVPWCTGNHIFHWRAEVSTKWQHWQSLGQQQTTVLTSSVASHDKTSSQARFLQAYEPFMLRQYSTVSSARFDSTSNDQWARFERCVTPMAKDFRSGRGGGGANKSWKHQKILLSNKKGSITAKSTSATPDFDPSSLHCWRRQTLRRDATYKSREVAQSSVRVMSMRGKSSPTARKKRCKRQARRSINEKLLKYDNDDLWWDDEMGRVKEVEDEGDDQGEEEAGKENEIGSVAKVEGKIGIPVADLATSADSPDPVETKPSQSTDGTTILNEKTALVSPIIASQSETNRGPANIPEALRLSVKDEATFSILPTEDTTLLPGSNVTLQSNRARRRQLLAEKHGLKEWKDLPKTEEQKQKKREANNRHQKNQRLNRARKKASDKLNQGAGDVT
ncbi:hypothetical protein BKA64DRAFT_640203 [Cadophora sp. MPI-SDFR-AT-0126]|nr:hypothetical protein BKA64DRAFT_640203 [Leotiomycetes sp. MPI-SDFR-AT-0126]